MVRPCAPGKNDWRPEGTNSREAAAQRKPSPASIGSSHRHQPLNTRTCATSLFPAQEVAMDLADIVLPEVLGIERHRVPSAGLLGQTPPAQVIVSEAVRSPSVVQRRRLARTAGRMGTLQQVTRVHHPATVRSAASACWFGCPLHPNLHCSPMLVVYGAPRRRQGRPGITSHVQHRRGTSAGTLRRSRRLSPGAIVGGEKGRRQARHYCAKRAAYEVGGARTRRRSLPLSVPRPIFRTRFPKRRLPPGARRSL